MSLYRSDIPLCNAIMSFCHSDMPFFHSIIFDKMVKWHNGIQKFGEKSKVARIFSVKSEKVAGIKSRGY